MRKVILLPAAILLLMAFKKDVSRFTTSEEMAKAVFAALQSKDVNRYMQLYPTIDEARAVFVNTAQTPESKASFEKRITEIYANNGEKPREAFSKTYSDALGEGFSWSSAVFDRIETGATENHGTDIQLARLTIIAKYNGKEYRIKLRDAFKTASGWTPGMTLKWGSVVVDSRQYLMDSLRKDSMIRIMRFDSIDKANKAAENAHKKQPH